MSKLKPLLFVLILLIFISGCSSQSVPASVDTPLPAASSDLSTPIPSTLDQPANRNRPPSPEPVETATPVPSADTAMIAFTFDDGPSSDYILAYPILQKYSIKGTSYVVTKFVDNNTHGRLSWDQIKEMNAYGWCFGCHTYGHIRLASMNDAQIKESMEKVDQSFINQGLPAPDITAYPYGSYNQRVIDAIKPYRKQARLAYYKTDFVDTAHYDTFRVPCISADMRSASQLKKVEKLVDKAVTQKAIIVFRVHTLYKQKPYDTVPLIRNIPSGCAPQTDSRLFAQLVEYCVTKGCRFITMDELLQMYP